MAKKITIYTTNTCAYCMLVKKWLGSKGHEYEEVNIDQHPERQKEALEVSGALTVPITVIGEGDDKEVVVGFNLPKIMSAVA